MEGDQADMLLTDPPYGVDYTGKTKVRLTIQNDDPDGLPGLLDEALAAMDAVLRPGAPLYVFHPAGPQCVRFLEAFLGRGWRLRQGLVWAKDAMVLGHADYHYAHEGILYGFKPGQGRLGRGGLGWYGDNRQTSVLSAPRPRAAREHPTMKPVELLTILLRNSSRRRELVLDPFAGSGSTLVACEHLGRRARLIELDPAYCDVIIARHDQLTPTRRAAQRGRSVGTADQAGAGSPRQDRCGDPCRQLRGGLLPRRRHRCRAPTTDG